MPTRDLHIDVLILGGGVAGLWTLAHLRKLGYNCLLVEKSAIGSGQTIASQGIIHGGVKYALSGESSDASASIARMPQIWDDCLAGRGAVDLTACRVLSREQFLWTTPGLISRIAGFGASKLVRAEGEKLDTAARPAAFTDAPRGVDVYRVPERVLDPSSLLTALAGPVNSGGCICKSDEATIGAHEGSSDGGRTITLSGPTDTRVTFRAAVLAAGRGNAALVEAFGCDDMGVVQQLRPLHMVIARNAPAEIFGHCLGASNLPRLTVTSARDDATGEWIWYIGGAISEGEGVARSASDQIDACRAELSQCVGWLDVSRCRFATLRVDRAEGVAQVRNPPQRPDEPTVARRGKLIVGWPTKLAFAPAFAAKVASELAAAGVAPVPGKSQAACEQSQSVSVAPLPWAVSTGSGGVGGGREVVSWT